MSYHSLYEIKKDKSKMLVQDETILNLVLQQDKVICRKMATAEEMLCIRETGPDSLGLIQTER
jgi:hypothetical protein